VSRRIYQRPVALAGTVAPTPERDNAPGRRRREPRGAEGTLVTGYCCIR
jgi:hypothetical protein